MIRVIVVLLRLCCALYSCVVFLVFILFLIGTLRLALVLSFWDMQPEYMECRACLRLIGS